MATATKKARGARSVSASQEMEFSVYADNVGRYHWTIVAAGGESLVQSRGFASYTDAERAAQLVRDGAGSARFEHASGSATVSASAN